VPFLIIEENASKEDQWSKSGIPVSKVLYKKRAIAWQYCEKMAKIRSLSILQRPVRRPEIYVIELWLLE
jgi:hypothetical protein